MPNIIAAIKHTATNNACFFIVVSPLKIELIKVYNQKIHLKNNEPIKAKFAWDISRILSKVIETKNPWSQRSIKDFSKEIYIFTRHLSIENIIWVRAKKAEMG